MKIICFPSFYPYNFPGRLRDGIFVHRQYKALQEHGAEIVVIQPVLWYPIFPFYYLNSQWNNAAQLSYPVEREYDGIKIYHPIIPNYKPGKIFNKPYSERYITTVLKFIEENKIIQSKNQTIIFSQWIPSASLAVEIARKLDLKSAVMVIGDDVNVWPFQDKNKKFEFINTWTNAHLRLAVANYLGNKANEICKKNQNFYPIYRGVDTNLFRPVPEHQKLILRKSLNLPEDKIIILCVATAIKAKGWLELLKAISKIVINNKNVCLIAIHSGIPDLILRDEVAEMNISDFFIDLGEIAPNEISKYYNVADIFCLPSYSEGIANVVVEAMASGLPVITTNVCGHPELIKSNEYGILINPKSVDELYNALMDLIINKEKRNKIGFNASQFIINEWGTFYSNTKKLFDLFVRILQ